MKLLHKRLTALLCTCAIAACSDPMDEGDDKGGEPAAIAIVVGATGPKVQQGGATTFSFGVTRSGGYTGPVTITVHGAPAGVDVPSVIIAAGENSGSVTIAALEDATPGNATLTLRATGDGVTEQTASVVLTIESRYDVGIVRFRFCRSNGGSPLFAAATGGDGVWRAESALTPGVYEFEVGVKAGIAFVQSEPGGGYRTTTIYGSREELQYLSQSMCLVPTGEGTLSLPISGAGPDDIVLFGLGPTVGTRVGNTAVFEGIPERAVDLIAGRTVVDSQTQAYVTDRLIMRFVNPPSAAGTIDFSQGIAPISATVTFANLHGTDDLSVLEMGYASVSSYATYAHDKPSASTTRTFYGFPTEPRMIGETHLLTGTAASSVRPEKTRTVTLATPDVEHLTLTFGPDLLTPTVTNVGPTAQPRFQARLVIQGDYTDDFVAVYRQEADVPRSAIVRRLPGYATNEGDATATFAMPDLSGLTGWNSDWGLTGGPTDWTVTATSYSEGVPPRYILQGASSLSASASGRR